MAYWTTREVASYLRLNEKKIYSLVAEGQLPAARISGKWLFERELIDRWVHENTVYPTAGLMGTLAERLLVLQGSDDWLLDRTVESLRSELPVAIVSSRVGSLVGLQALGAGRAHLVGCHVDGAALRGTLPPGQPGALIDLFRREQGLVLAEPLQGRVRSIADVAAQRLRLAVRQPGSGTWKLTERLFAQAGASLAGVVPVGPFTSHLEVALAVRRGEADAGVAVRVAAELSGLCFVPLVQEDFRLAVHGAFLGLTTVASFLDRLLGSLERPEARRVAGYSFPALGRWTPLV